MYGVSKKRKISLLQEERPVNSIYEQTVEYILDNQERMYRLAYSYVQNKEDALDAVQNAICTALEKCNSIRNPDALKTWLYRVVVNEALQLLRKGKKEISWDPVDMPEEAYWDMPMEDAQEIYTKVQKLPTPIKTIIILRFYEELSRKESAQVTGLNINTVKSRLYRGLADLGKTVSA